MSYTVKLPCGATFTMCPPAIVDGAEVTREYFRDSRLSRSVGDAAGRLGEIPEREIRRHRAKETRLRYKRMKAFRMPSGKMFTPPEVY